MRDTTHLLISAPQGQGYFRIHFSYFYQNLGGHLWNKTGVILSFFFFLLMWFGWFHRKWKMKRHDLRNIKNVNKGGEKLGFWSLIQQLISWVFWWFTNNAWKYTMVFDRISKSLSSWEDFHHRKSISRKWWRSKDFRPTSDMILKSLFSACFLEALSGILK